MFLGLYLFIYFVFYFWLGYVYAHKGFYSLSINEFYYYNYISNFIGPYNQVVTVDIMHATYMVFYP